jgi:membrane protein DedA with SNARE-associated domain
MFSLNWNRQEALAMHSILIWPALTVLAGAIASVPAIEDASNRAILYWVIVPSLLVGAVVVCSHIVSF